MGKILNRNEILQKKGLKVQSVDVPDWGGQVLYRPMSMVERREVRKSCTVNQIDPDTGVNVSTVDAEKMEVMCVITCCIDPTDASQKRLLFTQDDIPTLEEEMAAGGISIVAQAILKDSGMGGNAVFRGKKDAES